MLGILFVFLSSCFYGFSNAYWKKAVDSKPFLPIIFIRGIYSTLFFLLLCGIDYLTHFFHPWLGQPPEFSPKEFVLSFALCLFSSLGLYFFVKSIKQSPVTLVIPLSSINIFGLITAVFILGETWKFSYTLALVCVFMGIYLIYQNELKFNSRHVFLKALLGGLLASFFWGVSYTLFKFPIAWLGVLRFSFLLEFSVTCFIGLFCWFNQENFSSITQGPIRILALCLVLGSVFLHLAYPITDITKIVFAGKFQLIISIIAAKLLYREKIGWLRMLGISFLLMSIYLVY